MFELLTEVVVHENHRVEDLQWRPGKNQEKLVVAGEELAEFEVPVWNFNLLVGIAGCLFEANILNYLSDFNKS